MGDLVERIERSDGFILAAPTNLGSATALFKRFMERLAVYAYWPWGMNSPQYRKAKAPQKKAVLLSSSAAPGLMARLLFSTRRQLRETARVIGAEPVGSLCLGLVAGRPRHRLSDKEKARARRLAAKLARSLSG